MMAVNIEIDVPDTLIYTDMDTYTAHDITVSDKTLRVMLQPQMFHMPAYDTFPNFLLYHPYPYPLESKILIPISPIQAHKYTITPSLNPLKLKIYLFYM